MTSSSVVLSIPGSVWRECFDPDATSVPKEEGWPIPTSTRRGRGRTFHYAVDRSVALQMIEWALEFGNGISYGVDDPSIGRRIVAWADRVRSEIETAREP